ncbi:MAG TPA: Rieske 2Fe-2S domain-containing protein [Candidatus Kapabacteria bacterium]|nr:Rieske 2Fe-2S domain-containing protein [Candidatus Kapabacteria bacterium]
MWPCTHLSCSVYYSAKNDRLECPCHQGFFSVKDGSVLQGPPSRRLPQIVLTRNDSKLVAVSVKES